ARPCPLLRSSASASADMGSLRSRPRVAQRPGSDHSRAPAERRPRTAGRTVGPGPVRAAPSPGPRPCAMVAHVLSRAVIDLDGVVWRGGNPLPGAADAVARLLARGVDVVFCT